MKKTTKTILKYLLNKLGYFIIIDVEDIPKTKKLNHYSMNISFFGKEKTLDGMFINGEPANIQEFNMWSRHLGIDEINNLRV